MGLTLLLYSYWAINLPYKIPFKNQFDPIICRGRDGGLDTIGKVFF